MSKNTSMETRFSLNGTNLPQPIAESTCLQMNGTSSNTANMPWASERLSPKNRSNSSGCLTQMGRNPQRTKPLNTSKIDVRTLTDAQSKGLASRIIKYHDNSSRLNRSMSMTSLYTRPGQFPVVHLKKTEIPLKATKKHVSMTRIAPPEKSLFYGNTLSSLLRSNSIVGLQKSDEELSRENRPILHPPPTENDVMPTRSVLDVLKEISRKRINSDEDEGRGEATLKKYCNRDDLVDGNFPQNQQQQSQQQSWQPISYKRQREHLIRPASSVLVTPTTSLGYRRTPPGTQASPEQVAKARRLCSYNNDITSSLSSSLMYSSKRKLYDSPKSELKTQLDDNETPQHKKIQRQQSSSGDQQRCGVLTKSQSVGAPITPQSVTQVEAKSPTAALNATSNKPKLTLFNKNYVVEQETNGYGNEKDRHVEKDAGKSSLQAEDDVAYASVQFVKPKQGALLSGSKHPLIQRTQKSKLALMLCGLRGELYQGDEVDELDAMPIEVTPAQPALTIPAAQSSTTVGINNTSTTTSAMMITKATTTTTSTTMATTTMTTIAASPKSSIIGINALKSQSVATTSTTNVTTTISAPIVMGFKLTPPVETTIPTITQTSPNKAASKPTSPLVGLKLSPPTTKLSATSVSSAVAPTFSFGNSLAAKESVAATTIAATTLPVLGNFQFGANATLPTLTMSGAAFNFGDNSNITAKSNVNTTTTTLAAAAPASTMSTVTSNSAGMTSSAFPAPAAAGSFTFAFNKSTTSSPAPATTTITTTTNTSFTFGAKPAETTTNNVTTGSMFAPSLAATTTTATAAFTFGGAVTTTPLNPSTTTMSTPMMFNFAGKPTVQTSTTSNNAAPAFTFGSKTATAPSFAFGEANANTTTQAAIPAPIPTTTAASTLATGAFSFGAPASKPTAAAAPFSIFADSSANVTPATNAAAANSGTFSFGSTAINNNTSILGQGKTFGFGATTTASNTTSSMFANSATAGINTTTTTPAFAFGVPPTTDAAATPSNTLFTANASVAAPTTFAFGTKTPDKPAAATGAFAFGAAAVQPSNTTPNLFATPNANQCSVKPSFSFGAAATNTNNSSSSSSSNSAMAKKTNIFGSSAIVAPNNASATFESQASQQNKTFNFGVNSNTNNNNNLFGLNSGVMPTFGSAANGSTTAAPVNSAAAATPFTFGSKPNDNAATVKPFAFGAATATPAAAATPAPNMFGAASSTTSLAAPPPAFNFTATGGGATPNAANIFAPPPSDRPFRRATRRLNKP